MDGLALFGLCVVSPMLLFSALEDRSPWFVLGFAGPRVMGSVYGFLQGAVGHVAGMWLLVALRRWSASRHRV